jgi:hypothetical protein
MATNTAYPPSTMDINNPHLPGRDSMSPSKPVLIASLVTLGTKPRII